MDNKISRLGLNISALIEISIFFTVLLLVNFFFGNFDRFINISPHPFWIIVILVSVQYGTNEGLLTAIIASFVLLLFNLPKQTIDQNIYDYLLFVSYRPILWSVSAIIIGQLSLRHINYGRDLLKKVEKEKKANSAITKQYNQLKKVKETLESKVVTTFENDIDIYDAIKSLEHTDQNKVLMNIENVVKSTINPKKFSVFIEGSEGLEALLCSGWKDSEKYNRRFSKNSRIYNAIVKKKKNICIINEEEEKILGKQGIMAAPLIDTKSGHVFAMIKIEEIEFEQINIGTIQSFFKLCELVGMSYASARSYNLVTKNLLVDVDSGLLSFNFLNRIIDMLDSIGCKKVFGVVEFEQNLNKIGHRAISDIIKNKSKEVLFFCDEDKKNKIIFVFPGYDEKSANQEMEKILNNMSFVKSVGIKKTIK